MFLFIKIIYNGNVRNVDHEETHAFVFCTNGAMHAKVNQCSYEFLGCRCCRLCVELLTLVYERDLDLCNIPKTNVPGSGTDAYET